MTSTIKYVLKRIDGRCSWWWTSARPLTQWATTHRRWSSSTALWRPALPSRSRSDWTTVQLTLCLFRWIKNSTIVQLYKCTTSQLYNCTTVQLNNRMTAQPYNCTSLQLHKRLFARHGRPPLGTRLLQPRHGSPPCHPGLVLTVLLYNCTTYSLNFHLND